MKKLYKFIVFLPVCVCLTVGMAFASFIITAPDTIMDGKWFTIRVEVIPAVPDAWVYLKAVPAYPADSLTKDSLCLYPGWSPGATLGGVQCNSTPDDTIGGVPGVPINICVDTIFFKNKTTHPKDEWIKIVASFTPPPPDTFPFAGDSSKAIFARHGPYSSTKTNNQIRIIPNPIGTPGLPAEITIWRNGVVKSAQIKIFDSYGYLVKDLSGTVGIQISGGYMPGRMPNDGNPNPDTDMALEYSTLYTTWDGTNDRGTKVANGVYQLCVKLIQAQEAAIWKEKIGVIW